MIYFLKLLCSERAEEAARREQTGYLDVEVFAPHHQNQHVVEPMDPNNISWQPQGQLDSQMNMMTQGDIQTNAFIFVMGVALVVIILYAINKITTLTDAFNTEKKQANVGAGGSLGSQVSAKINEFLQNSDISNHVAQEEFKGGEDARPSTDNKEKSWRSKMIKSLKSIGPGQGKFDINKKFKNSASADAVSYPAGMPDANRLLGNSDQNANSLLEQLNTGDVGGYVPTEFPLESKLQKQAQEQSASPSSNDIEQYMVEDVGQSDTFDYEL